MARPDPHSVTDDAHPKTKHLVWSVRVDFEARRLTCRAELQLVEPTRGPSRLELDTRGLEVTSVATHRGEAIPWSWGEANPILGTPLRLELPDATTAVRIDYRTAPDASALQWLEPEQTQGGRRPFLFSQCQAIHARSVVPCQDTPARRISYEATFEAPHGLVAVMAAAPVRSTATPTQNRFQFEMPQPIPPYLLAFAVGDLVSKDLSTRSRVWAEPGLIDAAAWEFADVERHLAAAEKLFGPYDWQRFDLLVMPPSFPYGGMENPRLTFLTPTLLAGDRSLVNVVAHELAHSWTGNLVTNINAEHFWLNEGFTVFAERRILEALEGSDVAALHAAVGRNDLEEAVARFEKAGSPELTKLHTHLEGIDPDESFSVVPYEKGYLFLRSLEAVVGRERFDAWLKSWLSAHRFGSASTEDFLAHFEKALPGVLAQVDASAWIDRPGIPASAPSGKSERLERVKALVGTVPERQQTEGWSATQWQLFLDWSPHTFTLEQLATLDERFGLSTSKNTEVHVGWLRLALGCGSTSVVPAVEAFIARYGRMKYLRPLFSALLARKDTRAGAKALFERHRAKFHPIAQQVVSGLIAKSEAT